MKLTFIGAAHEVTGSCTLLELGDKRYLIDCGMEQGRDVYENVPLPIPASHIDAVFLTHAHIDHSGLLPKLYRDGFVGTIYATEVTADLCDIMLRDSAHIQEMEVEWKNRKAKRKGGEVIEPLYDTNDAIGALKLFRRCRYGEEYPVTENLRIRFTDIGHLLGSAAIELWLTEDGVTKKLVCSGDVGNLNQPLIKDPQTVDTADILLIESTYGNRLHEHRAGNTIEEFTTLIDRTFERGGSVIIPSFAVGRTQELLYALREIKKSGALDKYGNFPVYIDSPLAVESTQIFLQCDPVCFDAETTALLHEGINPIWFEGVTLSVTSDESRAINFDNRPKIIISASGMCEAGRIRHHLKHNLWKEENLILFVGYQAENSLGRKLLEGATTVRLFSEDIAVKAEIASLHGTSGHADQNGLLTWFASFTETPPLVFVNHGDEEACETLRALLEEKFGVRAYAPFSGNMYDLLADQMVSDDAGVKIRRKAGVPTDSRAAKLYAGLLQALSDLEHVVRASKGISNKDTAAFTEQIKALVRRWER